MKNEHTDLKIRRKKLSNDVQKHFLILSSDPFLNPLQPLFENRNLYADSFFTAYEGLASVISAAALPFELVKHSVVQRRFDRLHASARIRQTPVPEASEILARIEAERIHGEPFSHEPLSTEAEMRALESTSKQMSDFLLSDEGKLFLADSIFLEMNERLRSNEIQSASQELLVQTLISVWSVFESFSKSFVIDWINNNPSSAVSVASSSDLRNFFGKQIIDIGIIGDHGFDLSRSMGHVLFNERRLDSLSVIREVFKSLFSSSVVQSALGDQLWLLNQRRHLFVHKRGVVDTGYLSKTAALENKGDRLVLTSDDVKKHLVAVRDAIVAIGNVSTHT